MRRNLSLLLVGASALLAATACSDVGVAPQRGAGQAAPAASFDVAHGNDRTSSTFVIRKQGGLVEVRMPGVAEPLFTLAVPANAVCDPADGYGDFDSACTPLGQNVRVTATFHDVNGSPGVDFSPELRFDPSKVVTISTVRDRAAVLAMAQSPSPNWNAFAILYTPDDFQQVIADAQYDPDAITHINTTTGLVWRRIKHFSGYWVGTGYVSCDSTSTDPACSTTLLTTTN